MARTVSADYQNKAAQILTAAGAVFAEKGYERATMTDIARAAGFAKASTYHYFDSKEAVLFALLERSISDLLDTVTRADPGPGVTSRQRLTRIIEAYVEAFAGRVSVVTPLLLNLERLQPERRAAIERLERRLIDVVATAAGDLSSPLPPRIIAFLALGAANWTHYWFNPAGELSVDELARGAAAFLTGGLSAEC